MTKTQDFSDKTASGNDLGKSPTISSCGHLKPSEAANQCTTLPPGNDVDALAALLAADKLFVDLSHYDTTWFCELRNNWLGNYPNGSGKTAGDAIRAAHTSALWTINCTKRVPKS